MNRSMLLVAALALPLMVSSSAKAADEATTKLFQTKCGTCHGKDGKGTTKMGEKMKIADMTSAAWKKSFTVDKIKAAMNDGVTREKDGAKQEMKSFKDKLTPEQVDQLAGFVKGL